MYFSLNPNFTYQVLGLGQEDVEHDPDGLVGVVPDGLLDGDRIFPVQ